MNLQFRLAASLLMALVLSGCVSSASSVKKTVELKDYEKLERLLSEGKTPNNMWEGAWLTGYGQAIANGDLRAIDLFIGHGYEIPQYAVFEAVRNHQEGIVIDLLARGADINGAWVSNSWDLSLPPLFPALGVAVIDDNIAAAKLLLEHGAKRHLKVSEGPVGYFSALHLAIEKGKTEMVGVLLSEGTDNSDELNSSGVNLLLYDMTPMALAVKNGHFEIARMLANHGAFIAYDGDYPQPIDLALASGHDDIARWLESNGARRRAGVDYNKLLVDAGKAAVTVAVVAAGIAIAVEAAKYDNDYDMSPLVSRSITTSAPAGSGSSSASDSRSSHSTMHVTEDEGCSSDFSCGVGYTCVKAYLQSSGTCKKSVDASGGRSMTSPRVDSIGPNYDPQCSTTADCPTGFRCDLRFQACVK